MKDGGYIHHLILCKGWLWKKSSSTSGGVAGGLQYRKRFFELSNIALTYAGNEKKTGVNINFLWGSSFSALLRLNLLNIRDSLVLIVDLGCFLFNAHLIYITVVSCSQYTFCVLIEL